MQEDNCTQNKMLGKQTQPPTKMQGTKIKGTAVLVKGTKSLNSSIVQYHHVHTISTSTALYSTESTHKSRLNVYYGFFNCRLPGYIVPIISRVDVLVPRSP